MSRFNPQQSVSSVVSTVPATAAVFERRGIDFCCGGGVALADACARRGLSADSVLAELEKVASERVPDERDWRLAPLGDVIDHILAVHHEYVKLELPRLSGLMSKVLRVHGEAHPDTLPEMARLWERLAPELALHLRKEEEILFPALQALAAGRTPDLHCGVDGPMRMMELEHDDHGEVLRRLHELANNYVPPPEACGSWRALWGGLSDFERDLHRHVHLENNVLFPRARVELHAD